MDQAYRKVCRQVVRAEAPDVAAATLAEVRQLEDRFGLTHMSMLRLRWEITPAEPVERPSNRHRSRSGI
jgi:hypothetical protein